MRTGATMGWSVSLAIHKPFCLLMLAAACAWMPPGLSALAQEPASGTPATTEPTQAPADATTEQLFADYLHFARMGSFPKAEAYATALLRRIRPDKGDTKPEEYEKLRQDAAREMLALSNKYRNSRETLLMIISGSNIAENAEKILAVIREGEALNRKSPDQITKAIELLAGDPTQRSVGIDRLKHAGEYAIPWMIAWMVDPARKDLYPFIERSLAQVGKAAVNPLVIALSIRHDAVRQTAMDALGRLGYPQALPYLKRIATNERESAAVRETAQKAVARILAANPGTADLPAPTAFLHLAEQYYANTPSLRPDEREELANVWYCDGKELTFKSTRRSVFMEVMCMRCCEDALGVQPEMPEAVALWSAANFRREAKLGLDVQSVQADPKALEDTTRPGEYPRSLYFARCFGPRVGLLTLARGVKDRDAAVALGAVTALDGIASAEALLGTEDARRTVLQALGFPDIRVRINAALTLARTRPPRDFPGAMQVVPVLASALDLRSRPTVVIVDPNTDSRRLLEEFARRAKARVIAAARFAEAANRAREEATNVDLVVLASDMDGPNVSSALQELRKDRLLELAPVIIAAKPGGAGVWFEARQADERLQQIDLNLGGFSGLSDEQLAQVGESFDRAWKRAQAAFGRQPIAEEEALALSLAAADALRDIAVSGTSVFQFAAAEAALIRACGHPDEGMRLKAADALTWSAGPAAQSAIARLAMDAAGSESQRIAALGLLAESGKRSGRRLSGEEMNALTQLSLREPSLAIRTAASQALGALNADASLAAEIVRQQAAQ